MAVSAEPLRESAQQVLIEAHLGEGNWVEARRSFEAYRDLLEREFGTEPAPELAALVRRPGRMSVSAIALAESDNLGSAMDSSSSSLSPAV
jgi:DNA-binding SARP family transcriptional activator